MLAAYFHLLRRNRNFRLLWLAQVVSEIGDWFYSLAVYSLLLDLTHNRAQAVGLAVVLQVLPAAFVSPTAGAINDRLSRKAIMIGADVARFFVVLGMLLVRTPGMVWLAYPLLFLETVGVAFFEPAHSAIIPNLVEPDEVLAANALSSVTWSFCLAVGASLGGVAAVLLGRDAVFVLNALSFLGSAWLIRRMRFSEPHAEGLPPLRARELFDFTPIVAGFRYIRSDARLFSTVFVKLGGGLLGANLVLLPVLGQRVFPVHWGGLDASRGAILGMSLLMGSRGIGTMVCPLMAGRWAGARQSRLRAGIFAGFLLGALGYTWLGRSVSLGIACVAVSLAHGGSSINWVFSTTLLQLNSEDRFRGRVFMLSISASGYVAGVVVDMGVNPRMIATILGCVMLVPAAAWGLAARVCSSPRR
ncbi:Major facilitator superfamily MFS_1 [Candidatus Sulfopaludibacter sp. SbA3]|nr:Major facilitator superfamily MFS_1 [Candidatus Sulfopaludibacter sp. SbA3]